MIQKILKQIQNEKKMKLMSKIAKMWIILMMTKPIQKNWC